MTAARLMATTLLATALGGARAEPAARPTVVVSVPVTGPAWLDRTLPTNWNVARGEIPRAPPPANAPATSERCRALLRPPTMAGDTAVVGKGWAPVGTGQVFGGTELLLAASGADGMCRPLGFQAFVFLDGAFAGTLAPEPMDSRTDGALAAAHLRSDVSLDASFSRYAPADPLCCPSRMTTVSYRIERTPGGPVLVPVEARTAPAPRP